VCHVAVSGLFRFCREPCMIALAYGIAHQIQSCYRHLPPPSQPQQELTDYAKRRLRTFSHVGTTEQLHPSVESCAASLGMMLDGPAFAGGEVSAGLWVEGGWDR